MKHGNDLGSLYVQTHLALNLIGVLAQKLIGIPQQVLVNLERMNVQTKHNKAFNGSAALRAAGEWLAPFYPPAVLAHPPLKNGVMFLIQQTAIGKEK